MTTRRIFFLVVFAFILCSVRLLNRDFYYDEIYTIVNFLFIPLGDIVHHYVNLNNHVLYSLINALYLRLIGVHDIDVILSHPWVLRLPQFVFTISTLALVYRFGMRFLNPRVAIFAVLLLSTTIPFYYYACSIRGYGLSMTLFMGLLCCVWERWYIPAGLITAAFLYVMPSNAAFVVGVGLFCIRDKRLVIALGTGVMLAALLYSPILSGILADPQTAVHNSHLRILTESIPETVNAFISYRWLLIPVVLLGLYRCRSRLFWGTICITATALGIFLINGTYLWARVLFPLLPLWCIVTAEAIENTL